MLNIVASNTQLSIFNYAINKRFNFCLNASVLEIFNIVNTSNGLNFVYTNTINLNSKQIKLLSKYAKKYME